MSSRLLARSAGCGRSNCSRTTVNPPSRAHIAATALPALLDDCRRRRRQSKLSQPVARQLGRAGHDSAAAAASPPPPATQVSPAVSPESSRGSCSSGSSPPLARLTSRQSRRPPHAELKELQKLLFTFAVEQSCSFLQVSTSWLRRRGPIELVAMVRT